MDLVVRAITESWGFTLRIMTYLYSTAFAEFSIEQSMSDDHQNCNPNSKKNAANNVKPRTQQKKTNILHSIRWLTITTVALTWKSKTQQNRSKKQTPTLI